MRATWRCAAPLLAAPKRDPRSRTRTLFSEAQQRGAAADLDVVAVRTDAQDLEPDLLPHMIHVFEEAGRIYQWAPPHCIVSSMTQMIMVKHGWGIDAVK